MAGFRAGHGRGAHLWPWAHLVASQWEPAFWGDRDAGFVLGKCSDGRLFLCSCGCGIVTVGREGGPDSVGLPPAHSLCLVRRREGQPGPRAPPAGSPLGTWELRPGPCSSRCAPGFAQWECTHASPPCALAHAAWIFFVTPSAFKKKAGIGFLALLYHLCRLSPFFSSFQCSL